MPSARELKNMSVIDRMAHVRSMHIQSKPATGNIDRQAAMKEVVANHNAVTVLDHVKPDRDGADLVAAHDKYRLQFSDIANHDTLNAAFQIMNHSQEQAHDERGAWERLEGNAKRLQAVAAQPEVREYLGITPPAELAQAAFNVPMDPTAGDVVREMQGTRARSLWGTGDPTGRS